MEMQRTAFFLSLTLFVMAGCASAGDQGPSPLSRQQSATIDSLNAEIIRLNQELDGTVGSRQSLSLAQPKLEAALAEQIARGDVRVVLDPRGLTLTVLDHALFDPDETQFTQAGEKILEAISAQLSGDLSANRVSLEGHTDNQPIDTSDGVTNWEYSIGRASAVLHYFLDVQSMSPQRFSVTGYAEYRPVASNATEEGRDRNRRVEIVIAPQKVSGDSGPVNRGDHEDHN